MNLQDDLEAIIAEVENDVAWDGRSKRNQSGGDYLAALYEIKRLRQRIINGPPYEPRHGVC